MRKGIAVSVFVLGIAMTCASIAVLTLGAVGMSGARPRPRRRRLSELRKRR